MTDLQRTADQAVTASALELREVSAGYGATTVLREVSVEVAPGEVCALLGPNGAGKTTTLRAAAGTVRPNQGSIHLFGEDVTALAPHRRTRLGMCLVPEGRGIFKSLSVRENLRLQAAGARVDTQDGIAQALDAFPALKGRLNHDAGHLSGGQQQMLALARVYVQRPKVVLLDEVSMGLAPIIVEEIFQALRGIAATGVAMLIVEQYVTQALEFADHVVLLDKGTVGYDGATSELDQSELLSGYLGISLETVQEREAG